MRCGNPRCKWAHTDEELRRGKKHKIEEWSSGSSSTRDSNLSPIRFNGLVKSRAGDSDVNRADLAEMYALLQWLILGRYQFKPPPHGTDPTTKKRPSNQTRISKEIEFKRTEIHRAFLKLLSSSNRFLTIFLGTTPNPSKQTD